MLLSKMSIPFFWSLLNSECQGKLGRDCGSKGNAASFRLESMPSGSDGIFVRSWDVEVRCNASG